MSTGGLENNGESTGIGVLGTGDIGGDDDMGDNDDDGHDDGKNDEVTDNGDRGVEEHVDMESFLVRWLLH